MADCERALIKPINFVEAFVDLHRRLINSTDLAEDFFGDADAVQRLDLKADRCFMVIMSRSDQIRLEDVGGLQNEQPSKVISFPQNRFRS